MKYLKDSNTGIMNYLSDDLWDEHGLTHRSTELSPLYISRYAGPRTARNYTRHNHHELLFVVQGMGEFCSADGHNIALKTATALLIPPHMEHYEMSDQPMDTIWIGVTGSRLSFLPDNLIYGIRYNDLSKLFEQIYFESKVLRNNSGMLLDALLSVLLAKFFSEKSIKNVGIDHAIKYLHDNFHKPLNISQLAHDLGYSDGYFYRLFKKNYNMTPGEFLNKVRIEHAIEMIRRTSMPFSEIANLCGIKDNLYLSRLIKNATGYSPRALRKSFSSILP